MPKSIFSDLCCMLLNNMSKNQSIAKKLVPTLIVNAQQPQENNPQSNFDQENKVKAVEPGHLDRLLKVFVCGESKQFNKNAEFHFLAGVFANVSATQAGAAYFMGKSTADSKMRLQSIVPYTEHPNVIRRGGVLSTLKNVCFYHEAHEMLLGASELNFLVYILLPLCGPDEFEVRIVSLIYSRIKMR